jgi:hypothetical protein
LAARLRQRDAEQAQTLRAEVVPEPEQRSMADQVRDASRYYDLQIEKLDRQLAALKAGTGG